MYVRFAVSSSATSVKVPRRIAWRVMMPKKISTMSAREQLVGVKCRVTLGFSPSRADDPGCVVSGGGNRTPTLAEPYVTVARRTRSHGRPRWVGEGASGARAGAGAVDRVQPGPSLGSFPRAVVDFSAWPVEQMLVDMPCEGVQLGAVEDPVIADPASHLRVDLLGEAGQIRPTATIEVPCPDLLPTAWPP